VSVSNKIVKSHFLMKIRDPFSVGFMVIALFVMLMTAFVFFSYRQIAAEYQPLQDDIVPGQVMLMDTQIHVAQLMTLVENVLSTNNTTQWERESPELIIDMQEDARIHTEHERHVSDGDHQTALKIERLLARIIQQAQAMVDSRLNDRQISFQRAQITANVRALNNTLTEHISLHEAERNAAFEAMGATLENASIIIVSVTTLLLVGANFAGQTVSARMMRPLVLIAEGAEALRTGQLDYRVPVNKNDPFGPVGETFNAMAATLQGRERELRDLNASLESRVDRRTAELQKAMKIAQSSLRLKSEFLSTMSHELRTPLNAITGFCSIMLDGMGGEIDDDARHMLGRIHANGNHLLQLINEVLDLSKMEAGRMQLFYRPVRLAELAQTWHDQMRGLGGEKPITFTIEVDPDLPEIVQADGERLTQIAMNLVSNAFKFTHQGQVSLRLKPAGEYWQMIVSDTGIGIPPHALEMIFEEFRQVDGSVTRAYGGTGLGLAIVRNLCRMMNGSVTVSSELDKGSTFTITLPIAAQENTLELAEQDSR
jgi:signal transduction histidine kinase